MFSCEFWEIFKKTFFIEHLRATTCLFIRFLIDSNQSSFPKKNN